MVTTWKNVQAINYEAYTCGHCGCHTAPSWGYANEDFDCILLCANCDRPTIFLDPPGTPRSRQIPAPLFGERVACVPDETGALYREARHCASDGAYTAAVMCCRKLLMHIAVDTGAKEGESFKQYVDYLDNNHYVPPDGKAWVDYIRTRGNEANHEIRIMEKEDAESLITFIGSLLKFVYELPSKIPQPPTP